MSFKIIKGKLVSKYKIKSLLDYERLRAWIKELEDRNYDQILRDLKIPIINLKEI
jgi:hypothetical protein